MMIRRLCGYALVLGVLLSSACSPRREVYDHFAALPSDGWNVADVQVFDFSLPAIPDTYELALTVRHGSRYDNRNLWMFVSFADSVGIWRTDTVNCILADRFGKWYGSGWGVHYQFRQILSDDFRFRMGGEQQIRVQQAMRYNPVMDITDIGISVLKKKE